MRNYDMAIKLGRIDFSSSSLFFSKLRLLQEWAQSLSELIQTRIRHSSNACAALNVASQVMCVTVCHRPRTLLPAPRMTQRFRMREPFQLKDPVNGMPTYELFVC